jgi:hypothetical protein
MVTGTVKIVVDGNTSKLVRQSVLLMFKMTISSSHPVEDVNAYRTLVKGLMETNKATSAMAIVVAPCTVTPTRRTMSSYTPLAAMLPTNAHNPRGAAEATVHTQDLPSTAVFYRSSTDICDLFAAASVVYD